MGILSTTRAIGAPRAPMLAGRSSLFFFDLLLLAQLLFSLLIFAASSAEGASLLPNGEQTFIDANGTPLAGGKVFFYVPTTTTFKTTWQNAGQTTPNANPVTLDAAGRAIIYGNGTYRQVVQDQFGQVIWDQLTSDPASISASNFYGTSGGTPNAQTISAPAFTSTTGQLLWFIAGATNSGPMTLAALPTGAIQVVKDTNTGPQALQPGEVAIGNVVGVTYDNVLGAFHMVAYPQPLNPTFTSVTTGALTVSGATSLTGVISPTILASNQNDWTPTGISSATILRISASAPVNITGLVAQAGGRVISLQNIGAFPITLTDSDPLSVSANRFTLGQAETIAPSQGLLIRYDQTSATWRQLGTYVSQPVGGAIKGLKIVVTGDTTATIAASGIGLENSAGIEIRQTAVSLTCTLSVSGANGLDTGSAVASSWLSLWAIYNPSTGTLASLASLSATTPTLPAGYTFKTRLGWIRYDAGSKLWRTVQQNRWVQIIEGTNPTTPILLTSGASGDPLGGTYTAVALSAFVPSTAVSVKGFLACTGATAVACVVAPNGGYGGVSGVMATTFPPLAWATGSASSGDKVSSQFQFQLESMNVYYAAVGGIVALYELGWEDEI